MSIDETMKLLIDDLITYQVISKLSNHPIGSSVNENIFSNQN